MVEVQLYYFFRKIVKEQEEEEWGKKENNASSKVFDILKQYGLENNWTQIENNVCNVTVDEIVKRLNEYPIKQVVTITEARYEKYEKMMEDIIESLSVK